MDPKIIKKSLKYDILYEDIDSRPNFYIGRKNNKHLIFIESKEKAENYRYLQNVIFSNAYLYNKEDGTNTDFLTIDLKSNFEVTEGYLLIIANKMKKGSSLKSVLNSLKTQFDTLHVQKSFLKFRGDFGELLFLYFYPSAKKLDDDSQADFSFNDHLVEIKTASNKQRSVNISLVQLEQNIDKYGVILKEDNDGITIIDLASKIETNMPFIEHVINEYRLNDELSSIKYQIVEPKKINYLIPNMTNFRRDYKNVLNADFKIDISDIDKTK